MDAAPQPPAPPPPPRARADAAGPARYAFLVGRLHNRQITMEEATELFGIMQTMLRESQTVRARLQGAMATAPPTPAGPPTPARAAAPAGAPPADDLLLLGLLALGATAGLGAAFARRLGVEGARRDGPPARPVRTDPSS